ncbi:nuclear transport factor 2 family protein [Novosphingobium tardum]|uniref:Nuclear transport factor 2 family protein n=1 Tax=Novosphingobium tardum TaxID=1538021 RepID=A0ABV8RR79_9SPHN
MTLDELAAHEAIRQVLYRYCRGVDRGDAAMISAVYHPDAIDYHGAWSGLGREFGDYLVPSMDGAAGAGQHHITNVLIELDGASAAVESYFIAFHPQPAQEHEARHILVAGRYLDRFEQRDGAWLIAERHVVIDVSRPMAPEVADWIGAASFPAGARRGDDPSASLFRKTTR